MVKNIREDKNMTPYKIAFLVDEAAINTFESEYLLLPILRNLLRENAQVENFACRDGSLDDLCARIDVADIVFCYCFEDVNMSAAVLYAQEKGKEILHLEPSEKDLAFIHEKQKKKFNPYPGVYSVD